MRNTLEQLKQLSGVDLWGPKWPITGGTNPFPKPFPRPLPGPEPLPVPLPIPVPFPVPGGDFDPEEIADKIKAAMEAAEARRQEEERKRKEEEAKAKQVPVSMQDRIVRAEAVRVLLNWLFATSRDSLSSGRMAQAIAYSVVLGWTTASALGEPLSMETMPDIDGIRQHIEPMTNDDMRSFLDDPFVDMNGLIMLVEEGKSGQVALEAMYQLHTFGGWQATNFPGDPSEEALGLDRIVKADIWFDLLFHRWTKVSPILDDYDATATFIDPAPESDTEHRQGLQALMRSVSSLCLYTMHRDSTFVKLARDHLDTARAFLPPVATRALRALELQATAIDDIEAGRPALLALPGATAIFETKVDPNDFVWTALLLGDQKTVDLPLLGASIDMQALKRLVDENGDLNDKLPFQIYDPRLAVWLGLSVSLTWTPVLLGTIAVSLKSYELAKRLLDLCFKNVGRLPNSMRASVGNLAVPALVELVRAWSAELYVDLEDAPMEQQGELLKGVKEVIGLLASVSAAPKISVHVSETSQLSTSAIDPSWKNLINQALADPDQVSSTLPPTLVPALAEIRRRLLYVNKGVLSSGRFATVAPLWRFEYLFDAANFFVGQAKYAEERALEFNKQDSTIKVQRQQLLDAIEMAKSELAVAGKRVDEARASRQIAQDNLGLAQRRQEGAKARLEVYDKNSDLIRQYQAMSASLGSGSDGVFDNIRGYVDAMRREGRTSGPTGYMVGTTTYLATSLAGEIERTALKSQKDEASLAETLARDQVDAEEVRKEIAAAYLDQASRRLVAAQMMLTSFDADATNVNFGELAAFMQRIAEAYFNMATDAAIAAQSAFNYQYRTTVELISAKPQIVAQEGYLASTALALKLAQFRYFQLRQGNRRRMPVRWEVRLKDLFPESLQQLRAKGSCDFTLTPEHLNHHFPGLYGVTVLKVHLKSGITYSPLLWVLTNSPKGVMRSLNGSMRVIDQTVEARLNSFAADTLTEDILQSRIAQNQLEPFENTSPLCTWTLRYAGSNAATELSMLEACNIVIDLDAEFSELLAEVDQKATADRLLANSQVTATTLGTLDVDALKRLTTEGATTFFIPFAVTHAGTRASLFPEGAAELRMTGLALRLLSKQGVTKPLTNIMFDLEVPCDPAGPEAHERFTVAADAAGGVDPSTIAFALHALPIGGFSIKFKVTNDRLNNFGYALSDLADVAFAISYQVTKLKS